MDAVPVALPPVPAYMAEMRKPVIHLLITESKNGISLTKSATLPGIKISNEDSNTIVKFIVAHDDYTAYHVLFALRRHDRSAYDRLPATTKGRVLCDALARQTFLNDWGYLDPGGSHDGEAALALLELGESALEPLLPVLDDERAAPLFGSETATLSNTYKYRRKDFAYRYITLIRGAEPGFDPDPVTRDLAIMGLRSVLDRELGK